MLEANALTIGAGITTTISGVTFLGAVYFKAVERREERSISEIIGDKSISPREIQTILKQFRDDPSRLKALEMLLGERRGQATDLYGKLQKHIDVNRLANSQARSKLALMRILTITVLLLAGCLWGLDITASKNAIALNPNPPHSTNTITNGHDMALIPPNDYLEPKWITARVNIDWVFTDQGAHQHYLANANKGQFQAILIVQSKNKGAYESISNYGSDRTALYCKSKGWK